MDLGYFAADTLGVTLYALKGGLKGSDVRQLRCGPWRFDLPVDVTSDLLGPVELGFWVTLAKRIPFYAIVKEKENWLFVLDEAKLKKCGEKTGFAATAIKDRVTEIRPAIQAAFRWKGATWEKIQFSGEN